MLKTTGAILLALAIAACSGKSREMAQLAGDSFMGPADAKVVVTEYASPTCPFCKEFHDQYFSELKSKWVDTGKAKFVFREFPSHNPPVDLAIFALARCAGQADYFAVLDEAFARQQKFDEASRSPEGPRAEITDLGKKFNFSPAQVESCIKDPKNVDRIYEVRDLGAKQGVTGTPTIFVNDQMMQGATVSDIWDSTKAALEALSGDAPAAPAAAPATPAPAPKPN